MEQRLVFLRKIADKSTTQKRSPAGLNITEKFQIVGDKLYFYGV